MSKKKVLLISLVCLVCLGMLTPGGEAARKKSGHKKAQKAVQKTVVEMPKHTISINPLAPILSPVFPFEYEYTLSDKNTVAGRLGFGGWSAGSWSTSVVSLGGSYRFFGVIKSMKDQKIAPAGLWFGPALDFMIVSSSYEYINAQNALVEDSASSIFVSLGGEAGYEWIFMDAIDKGVHLTVSPSLFLGYLIGSLDVGNATLSLGGFTLGLGVSVGVAF